MRLSFPDLEFFAAGIDVSWNPEGTHRGREMGNVRALILHDTVTTPAWTDASVWRLLTHGRSGLPGPLCQLSVDRSGRLWLVANGRSNHNGYGSYGNDSVGIEVQCAGGLRGHEEPWNEAQCDTVVRACQVLLRHYDVPVLGHRESDPNRKIDPFNIDLDALRRRISEETDDMADYADQLNDIQAVLLDVSRRISHLEMEGDMIRRSLRLPLRQAVETAYDERGITIKTAAETARQRVARNAYEIGEGGSRTVDDLLDSLDGIVARSERVGG